MKRYIIEERESGRKACEGCMFIESDPCPDWPCSAFERKDGKPVIFVLVKEEEIK